MTNRDIDNLHTVFRDALSNYLKAPHYRVAFSQLHDSIKPLCIALTTFNTIDSDIEEHSELCNALAAFDALVGCGDAHHAAATDFVKLANQLTARVTAHTTARTPPPPGSQLLLYPLEGVFVSGKTPVSPTARDELYKLHKELASQAFQLMERKNHDYAGKDGGDPFANFRRCEALGLCSSEIGVLVRISDKLARLTTFTKDGELKVKDEGVKDTILDLINYCVLFYGLIKSKEKK